MKRRTPVPYLRALRRRSALSQDDVAFLLGALSGTRVSRHETGACVPPLAVALAYAVIFDVGVEEMHEDERQRIAQKVLARALALCESMAHRVKDPLREEKCVALERIIRRCAPDQSQ